MQKFFKRIFSNNQLGSQIHGFQIEKIKKIPEFDLTAIQLSNLSTGAQYLHIDKNDPHLVFSFAFQTAPTDSTGVPHILEHTTLCGSKKYPVRDPFMKMHSRSVATYMNAWTGYDYTMYPFSSENIKDFENLRDVYFDSCFFPLLKESDFRQEGWRLEHEKLTEESKIIFKGVVYNEMKGAFSNLNSLFCTRLLEHLLPDSAYGFVSGGDPKNITDLTYEQLKTFHQQHYHPSNAKFYSYGNYPLEKHLEYLNGILSQFSRVEAPKAQLLQKHFQQPKIIYTTCPPDPLGDPERQTKMCLSFMTNPVSDTFETFAMGLFSYLLMDGQASPIYKALIDSQLGSEYAASAGYDTSTAQSTFSIGLQGMNSNDVEKVEAIIMNVLKNVAENGFPQERIEAALHQVELNIKHKSANFGLNLAQNVVTNWIKGADPIQLMEVNQKIERLRDEVDQGGFFEARAAKYFLENQHRLLFVMKPDAEYNQQIQLEEEQRLNRKVSNLTSIEKQKILEQGKELLRLQDKKEDLSSLPQLKLSDMPKQVKHYNLRLEAPNSFPVQWRLTPTNELSYFRALVSISAIPEHLQPYVPLLAQSLTSLGTEKNTPDVLDELIKLNTGGISASSFLAPSLQSSDGFEQGILFSANCLDRNLDKMYNLVSEIWNDVTFDQTWTRDKLKTLIMGLASQYMNSLAESGHMFAKMHASSYLAPAQHLNELHHGLKQMQWLNQLAAQEDLNKALKDLTELWSLIKQNAVIRLAVNTTTAHDSAMNNLLMTSPFKPQLNYHVPAEYQGFKKETGKKAVLTFPFSSSYSAKCIPCVPYSHPDAMKLQLLSSLLSNHFLHKEIREKGGAYGGGATYSSLDGIFSFYSYRDPNPVRSVETFDQSLNWLSKKELTHQQLEEAKIVLLGRMDAPVSPGNEGLGYFKNKITVEMRQKQRDAIFNTELNEIYETAEKYLTSTETASCILAGEGVLSKEQKELYSKK